MADVNYTRHDWVERAAPSLNADHLNELEMGIVGATEQANLALSTATAVVNRRVNGKQLTGDITLTPADVRSAPNGLPSYAPANLAGAYDPARNLYNAKPGNTRKLRAGRARARKMLGACEVAIGDSLTAACTDGTAVTFDRLHAWPRMYATALAQDGVPESGTGVVRIVDGIVGSIDPRWTFGGSWGNAVSYSFTASSGLTATFTTDKAGTTAAVVYLAGTAAGGFTVSVNGATSGAGFTTVAPVSGALGWTRVELPGLALLPGDTVTVTSNSSNITGIYGAEVYTPGAMAVHNLGCSSSTAAGSGTSSWSDATDANQQLFIARTTAIYAQAPTAVHIALGVNDLNGGTAVSTVIAAITTIRNQFPNADVILYAASQFSTVTLSAWQAYVAALYTLADTLDCPLVDLHHRYGGFTALDGIGFAGDTFGHMTSQGYADWGAAAAGVGGSGGPSPYLYPARPAVGKSSARATVTLQPNVIDQVDASGTNPVRKLAAGVTAGDQITVRVAAWASPHTVTVQPDSGVTGPTVTLSALDQSITLTWTGTAWVRFGQIGDYVAQTRMVNGHALSADVTLAAADVSAFAAVNAANYADLPTAYAALVAAGGGVLYVPPGPRPMPVGLVLSSSVPTLISGHGVTLQPASGVTAISLQVGRSNIPVASVVGVQIDGSSGGGSGGTTVGVQVKDHYGAILRDVQVRHCGTGILITDTTGWSESSDFDGIYVSDCGVGIDIQTNGGTGSFGYASWGLVHVDNVPSGGVGFRLGAGAFFYHSKINTLIIHTSVGTCNAFQIAGALDRNTTIHAVFEGASTATARNAIDIASTAILDGAQLEVYFAGTWTNLVNNPSSVAFELVYQRARTIAGQAASTQLQQLQVLGDTQPRFYIRADGEMHWGPGGTTAPDTQLYRVSARHIRSEGTLSCRNTASTSIAHGALTTGDTLNRWQSLSSGKLEWGDGTSAVDANLYRASAGLLTTDTDLAARSVKATGLTGATAASRHAGGTASGAPTTGTFAVGDFVTAQDGVMWLCTVAGTPGTWVPVAAPLPYTVSFPAITTRFAEVGTWTDDVGNTCPPYSARINNGTGSVNDAVTWNVTLAAGTYTLDLYHRSGPGNGIASIQIDGSTLTTADLYEAAAANRKVKKTGLAITAGTHSLTLLFATKNGSSTGFAALLGGLALVRTGA